VAAEDVIVPVNRPKIGRFTGSLKGSGQVNEDLWLEVDKRCQITLCHIELEVAGLLMVLPGEWKAIHG
jgi:hypothetical protein